MKKIILTLTAMTFFTAVGCSGEQPEVAEKQPNSAYSSVDGEVPENIIEITLGTMEWQADIEKTIADFNRSSDRYRVTIRDYSDADGTVQTMQNAMKIDIVAGHAPDMILCSDSAFYKTLSSKGVFADISGIYSDMNVLANVKKICTEDDGKIYRAPMGFVVQTACTPAENGAECCEIFDYSAMKRVCDGLDANKILTLNTMEAEDFTRYSLLRDFTDLRAHTCDFDSPEFELALEFYKELKLSRKADITGDSGLISYVGLCNAPSINYAANRIYGGTEVVFTPPEHARISCNCSLTISEQAADDAKKGAEEFIRFAMSDANVNRVNPVYFPITESGFDIALNCGFGSLDDDGNKVECVMSDEDKAFFRDYITSVEEEIYTDRTVMSIFQEETEAYINGAASAAQCAGYIQSRASIYLSEQS